MSVQLQPPLSPLEEWIRAADPLARHHLPLLAEAQDVLDGRREASLEERRRLAQRLERWRYSHLHRHSGQLDPLARRLADVLDLAAGRLWGLRDRCPRWTGHAVREPAYDPPDVERALQVLDGAFPLAEAARRASALTRRWFPAGGAPRHRILIYAPLYLSSYCTNHCAYCGFRYPHQIERRHLSHEQAIAQADILARRGIEHLLLVAGDYPRLTRLDYYRQVVGALARRGHEVSVEIAPQSTAAYAELAAAGVCGVTLYQETYDPRLYALYHARGTKRSFHWRLEGLERAAEAGIRRLGLGILLGLADPLRDLVAMVRHAWYLRRRFPDRTIAFSLPRIHEAPEGFQPPYPVDDETFVRLYCALRIALPEAELVLSTREPAELRDRLAGICITQLSAGSSTMPGGYEDGGPVAQGAGADEIEPVKPHSGPLRRTGQQFPVADHRLPAEVAEVLRAQGFEVRWRAGDQ